MAPVNNRVVDNHPVLVNRSAPSPSGEHSHSQHSTTRHTNYRSALASGKATVVSVFMLRLLTMFGQVGAGGLRLGALSSVARN